MPTPQSIVLTAIFSVAFFSVPSFAQGPIVDLDDVILYAGGELNLGSSTTSIEGGIAVAVGDVNGSINVDSIFSQGSLFSNGFDNSRGEIFFNGSIAGVGGPTSVLDGPITSATGSIDISSSTTVNGDLTAAGNVDQSLLFATFNGDVLAGGDVTIEGTVNGSVTHGGALTLGLFAEVTGGASFGGPVNPAPFIAPPLPAGSGLSANTNDVNLAFAEQISLAPGVFGNLNFATGNTVTLTAGTYVFADIVSTFSLNRLAFDTTDGAINVFIAAPEVDLDLIQSINGISLFGNGEPDPLEAANVTLEVAGDLDLGSDFLGTLFVPNGDLALTTFADLTGRALVGGDVTLAGSSSIVGIPVVIPEPSCLLLSLMATGGFLRRPYRNGTLQDQQR